MGCLFTKLFGGHQPMVNEEETPRVYSWDKRSTIDKSKYIAENLTGEVVERAPGSVNGQQFIIQNCKDCDIYILDWLGTVSIDECTNCRIILGPVKTSVFVRDCSDCRLALPCQQFRTRDCKRLDVWLHCVTMPIIEATTAIRFACLQIYYTNIEDHFRQADVSVFCNKWSAIHDFTPITDETNFSFVPESVSIGDHLNKHPTCAASVSLSIGDASTSAVPTTKGKHWRAPLDSSESCLVAFFTDDRLADQPIKFVRAVKEKACVLVSTNCMKLDPGRHQSFLHNETTTHLALQGPTITLEFAGPDCVATCKLVMKDLLSHGNDTSVFVSQNPEEAKQQIEELVSAAEIQMAV